MCGSRLPPTPPEAASPIASALWSTDRRTGTIGRGNAGWRISKGGRRTDTDGRGLAGPGGDRPRDLG